MTFERSKPCCPCGPFFIPRISRSIPITHSKWPALARDHGATLAFLHVYPLPIAYGEVVARRQENGYYDELWQKLHAYKTPNLATPMIYRLEEGDAAKEILRVADELQCDLIVVGTHGRTGLGRLLMGSVAEQVMRNAPCPVLAVKGRSAFVESASEKAAADTAAAPASSGGAGF